MKISVFQQTPKDDRGSKNEIEIEKYTAKCKIDNGLEFSCSNTVDFIGKKDSVLWIEFSLFGRLLVDSIVDQQDNQLDYHIAFEQSSLWVRFKEPLRDSAKYSLKFYYHGDYIESETDDRNLEWLSLRSSSEWYPRYGSREKAYFDVEYITPKRYKFCSIGELKSTEQTGDFIKTHWVTNKKIRNASFAIGDFFEKKYEKDTTAPEMIFYYRDPAQAEAVAQDVRLSIAFFNKFYGEFINHNFYVSEIYAGHGEAFPGMLHLSFITFRPIIHGYQVNTQKGFDESFRAHEASHQWWGIGVDFKSYRDQWLSEGFASFSGLLYSQISLKNNDAFFGILKDDKKDLITIRNSWLHKGIKAGPISLGYRNNSEETRGDYQNVVYKKGEWVLHMLRNFCMNLKTMDESVFTNIMKEFFTTYKDSYASTQDFINIVNKHVGMDMTWFFKQWVDRNDIPSYKFGYETEKTPEGKFKVKCRITQTGVAPDFKMSIPVKVDFGNDQFTYLRINVLQPFSEFDFPLLPLEPKNIEFNVFESVLCEYDYDDYEDIILK